jgi:hypothetical protein
VIGFTGATQLFEQGSHAATGIPVKRREERSEIKIGFIAAPIREVLVHFCNTPGSFLKTRECIVLHSLYQFL